MESMFERVGGTYTLMENGIYYPDLKPLENKHFYGKYGMLRETFLKKSRRGLYTSLLTSGKLSAHLDEINDTANKRAEVLIEQMKECRQIDENLKKMDQIGWIQAMNQIYSVVEEIILDELIYS